jgi:DNA-binding MarR family transcriptional regulator
VTSRSAADLDRVWQALVTLVMDTRGDWRRNVSEATGLPFSRVRALRRIARGPTTLRALAEEMSCDAPAATVAVNDLERRGFVTRHADADDRRVKIVTLTPEGKQAMKAIRHVTDRAPEALATLPASDIAELTRILEPLTRTRTRR